MSIKDVVKKAQRIKHDKLDDEIERLIGTAREELIRVGVDREVVEADGSLVKQAVVTYCLQNLTEEKDLMDKYGKSFEIQADNIRKSKLQAEDADSE